jgi:UDPglucose 6-dehydrogenase
MNVGFIGLGKLGLPVALSIESKGHTVCGYDVNPDVYKYVEQREIPYQEAGTPELLKTTNIQMLDSVKAVVEQSEIIFVPIQTPHDPMYEGVTRLPDERVDFNYEYLVDGMHQINDAVRVLGQDRIVVIISTVLPGTIDRYIRPWLSPHLKLAYNPFFIAMGTTRADFENPEFVLLGMDDPDAANEVEGFYGTIHSKPVFKTSIRNAELIKVAYNTFISSKISIITTLQQVCEYTGCDIDAVSDAFALATDRLISTKYLRGGMPDGGHCHPRDNIALSWLSRTLGLKYDWFENIMLQREATCDWYADLIADYLKMYNLPVVIMGDAFKRGTNLIGGSPSRLLQEILKERGVKFDVFDPYTSDTVFHYGRAIYFVACNHEYFESIGYPAGSVVVDPWGITGEQKDVIVHKLGRR